MVFYSSNKETPKRGFGHEVPLRFRFRAIAYRALKGGWMVGAPPD